MFIITPQTCRMSHVIHTVNVYVLYISPPQMWPEGHKIKTKTQISADSFAFILFFLCFEVVCNECSVSVL